MLLKNDFVKLGLIVVGAVVLFQVLSRYNILQNEGYDSSTQALMPTYGNLMPSGNPDIHEQPALRFAPR